MPLILGNDLFQVNYQDFRRIQDSRLLSLSPCSHIMNCNPTSMVPFGSFPSSSLPFLEAACHYLISIPELPLLLDLYRHKIANNSCSPMPFTYQPPQLGQPIQHIAFNVQPQPPVPMDVSPPEPNSRQPDSWQFHYDKSTTTSDLAYTPCSPIMIVTPSGVKVSSNVKDFRFMNDRAVGTEDLEAYINSIQSSVGTEDLEAHINSVQSGWRDSEGATVKETNGEDYSQRREVMSSWLIRGLKKAIKMKLKPI